MSCWGLTVADQVFYGFDSSLTHFGYAVAVWDEEGSPHRYLYVKAVGVLITKPDPSSRTKTADTARRMEFLGRQLFALVQKHGAPAGIACEALAIPFGKTGMLTVQTLGRARGLVDAIGALHSVPVEEVQPAHLKRLVTGNHKASKDDVINAVRLAYPEVAALFDQLNEVNVEHAADAVGALHSVFAWKAGA